MFSENTSIFLNLSRPLNSTLNVLRIVSSQSLLFSNVCRCSIFSYFSSALIVSDFDVYSSSVIIPLREKSKSLLVLASVS